MHFSLFVKDFLFIPPIFPIFFKLLILGSMLIYDNNLCKCPIMLSVRLSAMRYLVCSTFLSIYQCPHCHSVITIIKVLQKFSCSCIYYIFVMTETGPCKTKLSNRLVNYNISGCSIMGPMVLQPLMLNCATP